MDKITPNMIESFKITKTNSSSPAKLKVILNLKTGRTKTISFGRKNYGDYTIYSKSNHEVADDMKRRYLARHKVREDWSDLGSAGFWAKEILWNKRTVEDSIDNVVSRFELKYEN
jgi:hypothetical protein